jgi:hypothetical protein
MNSMALSAAAVVSISKMRNAGDPCGVVYFSMTINLLRVSKPRTHGLLCGLSKTAEEAVDVFLFFLNGIKSEITEDSSDGFSISFFCSSSKRL